MNATLTIDDNRPGAFERLWARLVSFVAAPGDDDETLRKKRLLLVVVLAKAPVCPSLAFAFYSLGVPLAALVPVVYQVLTVVSVIVFLITRNFERFRFQQALLIFLGPIALHYFLGGFVNSSGVILSSFLAPLIAILFHGGRQSWPWFVALWIVLLVLAVVDPRWRPRRTPIPDSARVAALPVSHRRGRLRHLRRHPLPRLAARCREGRAGFAQRASRDHRWRAVVRAGAARGDQRRARRGRTAEVALPRQHVSRAAHAAQRHHRLQRDARGTGRPSWPNRPSPRISRRST